MLSSSEARTGDTGRAFERAGGFNTSQQDWSVTLSADLARMEDVREVPLLFSGAPRRWEHVSSPPETLFAQRLGAIRPVAPAPTAVAALPATQTPVAASATLAAANISVLEAQRRLRDLGHYRGTIDGLLGPGTRAAIRTFERDRGLPETSELAGRTAEALLAIP